MGPLRPARPEELQDMAKAVAKAMVGETRVVDDCGVFVQIGPRKGLGLHRRVLLDAFKSESVRLLNESDCIAVADVDGEAVGWIAWSDPNPLRPLTIRFVFVDPLVRRRGFGRLLLSTALANRDEREPRLSCITPGGAELYRAVAASTREPDGPQEQSRVVEV